MSVIDKSREFISHASLGFCCQHITSWLKGGGGGWGIKGNYQPKFG